MGARQKFSAAVCQLLLLVQGGGGSGGGEGGSILLLADGGQEMQMVAGGNGLSSASKYGLGGWAGAGLGLGCWMQIWVCESSGGAARDILQGNY